MSDLQHDYKTAKEAFVSQLEGGSIYQINIVSLTALTTFSFWATLRNAKVLPQVSKKGASNGAELVLLLATFCLEYFVLVLPIVLAVTLLSDYLLALNGILLLLSLCISRIYRPYASTQPSSQSTTKKKHWSKVDPEEDESEDERFQDELHHETNGTSQGHAPTNNRSISTSVDSFVEASSVSATPPTPFFSPITEDGFDTARSSTDSGRLWKARSPLQSKDYTTSAYPSPSGSSSLTDIQGGNSPLLKLKVDMKDRQDRYIPRNQPFLSVYRAHMMLMTIICILAVDFPAFPRQYAKCETWGTSLMDLGVGSFVFSMGIVSALPLLRSPMQRFKPLKGQLLRDARRSIPLLLLGSIRVIMVKGVEYPEHISEYGVHWNFFFTLALLSFFGTLCRPLARRFRYSTLGLTLSIVHQGILSYSNLGAWAISNSIPRTNLLSQNKEGLTSLPGYLSIFLLGMDLGLYVLPKDPYLAYRKPSKSRKREKTDKLAMLLASLSILWWAAYYFDVLIIRGIVSRRMANLAYVLWITAYNTTFLFCYVLIYMVLLQHTTMATKNASSLTSQHQSNDDRTPLLLQSLNHSAFIIFLVANLLTGLVNVSFQTMYSSDLVAIVILTLYTATCLFLATLLYRANWRLPI